MTLATFPRLAAALLLGAAMLAPSPADAGRRDHRYEHRYEHRDWDDRDYRHGYRDGRRDQRRWERHDDRRDWRRDHRGRVVYREVYPVPAYGYGPPPRHYGPPRWARGHRIHDYGWAPTYVVVDYDRYGLRHPPRGYHWRRDDRGDWLLVAIASGIIADVILGH
jgi:Ni/Co efflux regulator RcnB